MAKSGRKLYYWDTTAFIAWIDGGVGHPNDVINGLDEIAKEITENRANLCTSVNTKTEILQGKLTPEQRERLNNLFRRRNVSLVNVDSRIADLASEIRNYYNERSIKIKTPDAQHLATAIIYGADEFHALDGNGDRARPSDLLRLDGSVAGRPLHIRVPIAVQGSLLAGVGPLALDSKTNGGVNDKKPPLEISAAAIQGSSIGPSEGKTTEEGKQIAAPANDETNKAE